MKDCNKKSVERADSIDKLATLICGYGYYAHHNDDRDHPIPKDAVKEYLEMGASFARQQMMKAAVLETKVIRDSDGDGIDYPFVEWLELEDNEIIDLPDSLGLKEGDRVKLIIIKEEQ